MAQIFTKVVTQVQKKVTNNRQNGTVFIPLIIQQILTILADNQYKNGAKNDTRMLKKARKRQGIVPENDQKMVKNKRTL